MEHGRGLAWVIDDDVVDIVIVYYVGNVATWALGLNSLLLLLTGARRGTTATHSEALTVWNALAFKSTFVLTLLSHRVFSKLLWSSERSFLIVSITVYEIVTLFLTLLRSVRLLSVIWAKNAAVTISHITLPGEFSFSFLRDSCLVFKVRLVRFHIGPSLFAVSFDLGDDGIRLVPQVVLVSAQGVPISVFLLLIEQVTRRSRRLIRGLSLAWCGLVGVNFALCGWWPSRSLLAHVQLVLESTILLLTPIWTIRLVIGTFLLDVRIFRLALLALPLTALLLLASLLSRRRQGVMGQSKRIRANLSKVAQASQLVTVDYKLFDGTLNSCLLRCIPMSINCY